MKFDLIAEFETKSELIDYHARTPADAYRKIGPFGGRNNRIVKKPYLAYRKAENDLEWKPGQLDMIKGEFATDPVTLPERKKGR